MHFIVDSITVVPPEARGHAVVCGSHGGRYAAYCARKCGVSAVIFNDAGIGRERAGVAGLASLDAVGIAAAAVSCRSSRIGDGRDTFERGVISTANETARSIGIREGVAVRALEQLISTTELAGDIAPFAIPEEVRTVADGLGDLRVVVLDSVSLVTDADRGAVVVTASHGGLLGGIARTAIKADVYAAIFNDATMGIDNAGVTRLPALQARGIAGVTVSAWSARIGDGRSTLEEGYVSAMNDRARELGAELGISARTCVERLAQAR